MPCLSSGDATLTERELLPPRRTARPGRRRPPGDPRRRDRPRRPAARVPHRHRASASTSSSTGPSTSVAARWAAGRWPGSPTRAPSARGTTRTTSWGWFRGWGGGMVVTCGLDHTLGPGEDSAEDFHQPHIRKTAAVRPARPGRRAAGPARRLRRALGGRRLRPVGRGRGPPVGDLRRAPAAAPAHRGTGGREPLHDPRRGRERRPPPAPATCSCTTATPGSRSSTTGPSCSCPRSATTTDYGVPDRGLPDAERAHRELHRGVLRARARRRAGGHGAGRRGQPGDRAGRLPGLPASHQLPHHTVWRMMGEDTYAHGHGAEHEPRRGALGRAQARRAAVPRSRARPASTTWRSARSTGPPRSTRSRHGSSGSIPSPA